MNKQLLWRDNSHIFFVVTQIDSAMQMTPFSDEFLGCRVNSLYTVATAGAVTSPVYVNLTLQLEESAETLRPAVKKDIQRHLLGVIHRRSNNIGSSPLWVDSPAGSVSQLQGEHPPLLTTHSSVALSTSPRYLRCPGKVPDFGRALKLLKTPDCTEWVTDCYSFSGKKT